ncbi:hypothetical protein TNIN_377761 [Trichonephila inaurata madagascariensis]|uniref:Uncharacterized protein n=1 Tax=Trichonephila inaurata madagascariensis TaxID=2747483 RepID=A0A8X7CME2_9ARAC|nr:hypothetical protein TNIN_377761 [Trichonephila inaurata madagascariensis]
MLSWRLTTSIFGTLSHFVTYRKGFCVAHGHKGSSCQRGSHQACLCVLADDPPSSGPSLPTPDSSRPTRSGRRVHFTDLFQA